jgi:tRNA threonylcarbamoyladenosine biosynthesis protein TsaB
VLGATYRILAAVRRLAKNPMFVSGVVVARGPGSFTAIRMGVVVANAVAFGLGVPISGVRVSAGVVPSRRSLALLAAASPRRRGIVLPVYDRPPSITKRKH